MKNYKGESYMISLRNVIAKYNKMSLSGKYNRAYLEGYRQCIVDLEYEEL